MAAATLLSGVHQRCLRGSSVPDIAARVPPRIRRRVVTPTLARRWHSGCVVMNSSTHPILRTVFRAALAFAVLSACGDGKDGDDGGGGGSTGSTGDVGATEPTGSTGAANPPLEIGTCQITPDCPALCIHLNWGDCSEQPIVAHTCGAKLLVSGAPGVLEAINAIGPDPGETQDLIVLRGDGTALTQSRSAAEFGGPYLNPGPVMRCDVVVPPGLADACAKDEPACAWDPWTVLQNCQETEVSTCAEVESAGA